MTGSNTDRRQVFDETRLLALIGDDPDTATFLREAKAACYIDAMTYVSDAHRVPFAPRPFAPRPFALIDVATKGVLDQLHAGEVSLEVARGVVSGSGARQYHRAEIARWLRDNGLHSNYPFDNLPPAIAHEDPVTAARRRQHEIYLREKDKPGVSAREAARRAVAAVSSPPGWAESTLVKFARDNTWPSWLESLKRD